MQSHQDMYLQIWRSQLLRYQKNPKQMFLLKYTKNIYTVFFKNFLETVFSQKPTSKACNMLLVYERALMGEILDTENHCFLK